MSQRTSTVAVVGATGAVGEEMIQLLAERQFPVRKLLPLASARSLGRTVSFGGEELPVEILGRDSFAGVDLALFSAGAAVSREYAPLAVEAGAVVVDNSSAWRYEPEVPLVIPEVNPGKVAEHRGIIATPNCSTIQLLVVLAPLHRRAGIRRMVVDTYQAASGAGRRGMDELAEASIQLLSGKVPAAPKVHPRRLAFNCIPQVDRFLEDGSTREEWKMVAETAKILDDPTVAVSATCVRVPVFSGHSEAVSLELATPLSPEEAREILKQAPGVVVLDDPTHGVYPTTIEAAGNDPCFVGRIRRDPTVPQGLKLWIVADNVRKGAALNAVQIAELLPRL